MTGLPRNSGRASSSTETKNASMSTCRMEASCGRGVPVAAGSVFARKRANSGMLRPGSGAFFGGEDAGDSGEIFGDIDISPHGIFQKRADSRMGVVSQLEDKDSSGLHALRRLADQRLIKVVSAFAGIKRQLWLVLADLPLEGRFFIAADVGRIADDEIEQKRLVTHDWGRAEKTSQ